MDECCGSDIYWCPRAGRFECPTHGGHDVCCDRPERHTPLDRFEVQARALLKWWKEERAASWSLASDESSAGSGLRVGPLGSPPTPGVGTGKPDAGHPDESSTGGAVQMPGPTVESPGRRGAKPGAPSDHDLEQHAGYFCATHGFVLIDFCSCPDDDIVSLWTSERDDDQFVRVLNRYRESSAGGTSASAEGGLAGPATPPAEPGSEGGGRKQHPSPGPHPPSGPDQEHER